MFRGSRQLIAVCVLAIGLSQSSAFASDPIGDFFKRVGRTLNKPHATPSRQTGRKNNAANAKTKPAENPAASVNQATPQPDNNNPAPPPPQPTTLAALSVPQSSGGRDLPYAVPVANRPGFVTSPYAPTRGFVDVRNFPTGTEVKDPYTGKIFRTP